MSRSQSLSKLLALSTLFGTAALTGIIGGYSLLLASAALGIVAATLVTDQNASKMLNRPPAFVGGSRNLFLLVGLVVGISLLAHGVPAHAQLFDGARDAADSGIGAYIGTDESTSIIDVLTFAMWALIVVGAIGVIVGGVSQNAQILVGSLSLFFGIAILIGVLEFTDGLLFGS